MNKLAVIEVRLRHATAIAANSYSVVYRAGNLFAIYVFPFTVLYFVFQFTGFGWFLPYAAGLYLVLIQLVT